MHGFSHFNQILLSFFDVSDALYDQIINIKTKMCQIG